RGREQTMTAWLFLALPAVPVRSDPEDHVTKLGGPFEVGFLASGVGPQETCDIERCARRARRLHVVGTQHRVFVGRGDKEPCGSDAYRGRGVAGARVYQLVLSGHIDSALIAR